MAEKKSRLPPNGIVREAARNRASLDFCGFVAFYDPRVTSLN
jgi:hypothetical protein